MRYGKTILLLCCALFLETSCSTTWEPNTRGGMSRALEANRVDELDKTGAICEAGISDDPNAPVGVTQIKFYYAIESESKVSIQVVHELDRMLYYTIGDAVLWCSQPNDRRLSSATTAGNERFLTYKENRRSLSEEDARRLGIISFNSAPSDLILTEETCAQDTESNECVIVEGRMALMAHQTDSLEIIIASILDGVQDAMDDDILVPANKPCSAQMCTVEKVRWLGTTIEEARNGGPIIVIPDANSPNEDDDDEIVPMLAYAAIPIAMLLLWAFLLQKKRRPLTAAQLALEKDWVRVGTGDPPRHFHEGMYHYTRSGARYLSTNCPDCEETRRLGFSTDADLPTIAEGRLFAPESVDESETDASDYRKGHLIGPDANNLAGKHSSIDVHQCQSATCRICNYRPKDVAFVSSPRAAVDGQV